MIKYEQTTEEHIEIIWKKLRYFDKLELLCTGVYNYSPAQIIDNMNECYTALLDGVPEAFFGYSITPTLIYFCFIGSDEIYNHTKTYTKYAKTFIKNRMDEFFDKTATIIVHPDNTKSIKWIKYMGFEYTKFKHNRLLIFQKNKIINNINIINSENI